MKWAPLLAIYLLCRSGALAQTYSEVKPIFDSKCVTCHQAGDGAPFPLTTYASIRKRITFIKQVIETGYMPPWRADSHYRAFANDRSLTEGERRQLLAWMANNAPDGPSTPGRTRHTALTGREPDLVLTIDSLFLVKGNNEEQFVSFKVPFALPQPASVEAVEFYTNNKKIVHHINYGFYAGDDTTSMVYYTGWIPGASREYYPGSFGWTLPKRGVVVFTVHYSAISADERSLIGVKLFFKKNPVERPVRIVSLGSSGIGEGDIFPPFPLLPNQVSTVSLQVKTPEDQSVLYVWPHMHFIGKEFYAYAVTPDRDTIRLVHIPEWDFRWQELYRMKQLVHIPAGSVIHMVGTYDNTDQNPSNPNHPPKFIFSTGNMESTNEMFTLLMIYVPYRKGDEDIPLGD